MLTRDYLRFAAAGIYVAAYTAILMLYADAAAISLFFAML